MNDALRRSAAHVFIDQIDGGELLEDSHVLERGDTADECVFDRMAGFVGGVDDSWREVPYDTGRAVLNMLMSGTLARFQDITWIFSHSGGTVPILAERVKALGGNIPRMKQAAPRGIDHELKRLYYETANGAWRPNLAALLGYVPVSQVMFGTDYPYVTVGANLEGLRAYGLSGADLNAIQYENAARVIPAMRL